jgi:hypothetical protein
MAMLPELATPVTPVTPESLRELRVQLQLQVRVWGIDAVGKTFSQIARTVEISALGARLAGLHSVQEGDIVGIQYADAKGRFRVVWIGRSGTEESGMVGVECVEPGKCIWTAVLKESAAAAASNPVFKPALPPGIPPAAGAEIAGEWPRNNRRLYPRVQCAGALRIKQVGTEFEITQRLTDISLGGCYGESMGPLTRDTQLDMVLEVSGERIAARGMVRTCHPSMGNGIGFTNVQPEDWKKLVHVIQQLGGANIVFDAPVEPDIGDAIEALLSLLQKKGVHVTRDEFLDELRYRMIGRSK